MRHTIEQPSHPSTKKYKNFKYLINGNSMNETTNKRLSW